MKKIIVFLLTTILLWVQIAFTQGCPPNIHFEGGEFSNGECFIGLTTVTNGNNLLSLSPSAAIAVRHENISANIEFLIDPYRELPRLSPYWGAGLSDLFPPAPHCIEKNSPLSNAHYGVKSYTWCTSDLSSIFRNQQSIVSSALSSLSGALYVNTEPYPGDGCRDTVQATVKPLPLSDSPVTKPSYYYYQFEIPTPILSITEKNEQI
jgi:hypothetical protein